MIEEVAGFEAEFGAMDDPAQADVCENKVAMAAFNSIVEVMFDAGVEPDVLTPQELAGEGLLNVGEAREVVAAVDAARDDGSAAAIENLRLFGETCGGGEPGLPEAATRRDQLFLSENLCFLQGAVQGKAQRCSQGVNALAVRLFNLLAQWGRKMI